MRFPGPPGTTMASTRAGMPVTGKTNSRAVMAQNMTKITMITINARRTCRDCSFDSQLRDVDLRVAAGYGVTNELYLGASTGPLCPGAGINPSEWGLASTAKPKAKANPWHAERWDSAQKADATSSK